jgi:hypothetical protein
MFEASVDLVEKEPDMDVILDILHEHFPGIGMEEDSRGWRARRTR